jgi:hypothetical protein
MEIEMDRVTSLASQLEATTNEFGKRQSEHFRTALGDGAVGEQAVAAVLEMARGLLSAGSTMVRVPLDSFAESLTRQILERPSSPGRLSAQVELEIARIFVVHTDEMAERCLELARIALQISPGEPVLQFLNRLGRCYIAGFFPESVVMCRAVLENAVVEKFARERKPLPIPGPGKSEMRARLNRAEEHGWLTRKQRDDAWAIWERGSKAAHRDPHVTKAVLDTIKTTVTLLGLLYDKGSAVA